MVAIAAGTIAAGAIAAGEASTAHPGADAAKAISQVDEAAPHTSVSRAAFEVYAKELIRYYFVHEYRETRLVRIAQAAAAREAAEEAKVTPADRAFATDGGDPSASSCPVPAAERATSAVPWTPMDGVGFVHCPASWKVEDRAAPTFSLRQFEAIAQGFVAGMGALATRPLIEALPAAPGYMTLMLAVRFLVDFLEGDRYFQIDAPDHNLRRAATQLSLAEAMSSQLSDMHRITQGFGHDP